MHALPLLLGVLCSGAVAYRYYSGFLAAKVLALDDARVTPAHRFQDGHNFMPMNKWVLFGHHFAAITGAGPLVGPTLAAQFGYLPGYLWILVGVVLAGAVHDFVVLAGSIRHDGKSIAEIARVQIGPRAGFVAGGAILFIVLVAISAMCGVVVNALAESAWGTFTIACTIPIALYMGMHMFRFRPGKIVEASVIGVALLLLALFVGKEVADSSAGTWFVLSRHQLTIAIVIYGFFASVLPVWLLLAPRDYLSSYMKLGTIALLIVGVAIVNPEIKAPAFSQFLNGGPIVPGPVFPFVFITIACGAISGFHGLIGSGTTPKLIDRESHARPIGYGSMIGESIVAVVALIAACSLPQGDYFAVNTAPAKFAELHMQTERLPELSAAVGEKLEGRTGGAVSLALGISLIFAGLPGMGTLMKYWFHFAILFEALFILTTVDAGTRVARFLVQEFVGKAWPRFGKTDWMPGTLAATSAVCFGWGYLVWNSEFAFLWSLLGISNQLLACISLCAATSYLINNGKARYAWVTLLPLAFVGVVTETAGFQLVANQFLPKLIQSGDPKKVFQGALLASLCVAAMVSLAWVFAESLRVWLRPRNAPHAPHLSA